MRRIWAWTLVSVGTASLMVLGAFLVLPGLEEVSWAAGTGSFVLAAAALVVGVMALAWPRRTPTPPTPAPSPAPVGAQQVSNRMGDNSGTAVQVGTIHGPVTVHSPPTPTALPVPGWVDTALPAHQADPRELGAHHAPPGPDGEDLPPYVARDVDGDLDQRLAEAAATSRGGLVLVAGASTAGKTRALAAALARTLPDRMLVAPPEDADLRPLPAWLAERAGQAPRGWVVWLDDLDRHLGASGLTPALVAELGQAGAMVAATIRQERLETLRPSATDHTPIPEGVGYPVLKTPPVTVERRWSTQERERARTSHDQRLVQAADDERFGVAEQLAAGPRLQQTWDNGPDSGHPRGYALVAAAVGLAQAGVSSPLTREQLHAAHTAYLPDPPPLPEEIDQAWEWAARPRSGQAGLLVPSDHDGRRWRAFDYLTTQNPLPEAVWRTALDTATDQDRLTVGITAYHDDRPDVAEAAWRPLAEQGRTLAMNNLGVLLEKAGRAGEAEDWFRKATEQGDATAMYNLGVLLKETGRAGEAEDWYRKAAEQGDATAMNNLGVLLKETGRAGEAEDWYRKATEQGDATAMNNLGVLLKETGRAGEAEDWYRKATEQGDTAAMNNLGLLLEETGRLEEAEDWWRQAAEQGDTDAMFNLGHLLEETGQVKEAEGWYRKAAEQDDTITMFFLGLLLEKTGRLEEAEDWLRRAAEQGDTAAMNNLGLLLEETGRLEEAEDWWRQAAEQGDTAAMNNLGLLLEKTGRLEEAEDWWRQAAEQGDTLAMNNLGLLLEEQGRVEEAEQWRRRAREIEGEE